MPSLSPAAEMEHDRCEVHATETWQGRLLIHAERIPRKSSALARPKNLQYQHLRQGHKPTLHPMRLLLEACTARCLYHCVRRTIRQVGIVQAPATGSVCAGCGEPQLRLPPKLHPSSPTHVALRTALLDEGKEAVHVRRDTLAGSMDSRPHYTSVGQDLAGTQGIEDGLAKV